jgi:N-methylhydantoinase A
MLESDAAKDYSRTVLTAIDSAAPDGVEAVFRKMERGGAADLRDEGFAPGQIRFVRSADLRYLGQSYELNLPVPPRRRGGTAAWRRSLVEVFHRRHLQAYGYARTEQPVELVNLRVQAVGISPKPRFARAPSAGGRRRAVPPDAHRTVWYRGGRLRLPVYGRKRLRPGDRMRGPAVVSEYSSTLFVAPGFEVTVDPYGNLVVQS